MVEIPELTNGEFESFSKDGLVLVDFFADWCMPCMMMSPILEDLAEAFVDKMKIGKVNIDDNSDIAQKFEITSIPTFVLFKDGEVLEKISGARNLDELSELVKKYL